MTKPVFIQPMNEEEEPIKGVFINVFCISRIEYYNRSTFKIFVDDKKYFVYMSQLKPHVEFLPSSNDLAGY